MATLEVGQIIKTDKLKFAADSDKISTESIDVLKEIFGFLSKNKTVSIEIGGHTIVYLPITTETNYLQQEHKQ